MPLVIHKRQPNGDSIHCERLRSFKVGSTTAPFARFPKPRQGDAAEDAWEFEPLTLAHFAGVTANGDETAVLFEVTAGEPGAVCLSHSPGSLKEALRQMKAADPDLGVGVKGADNVDYQHVVDGLEVLQQLEITKVGLATEAAAA